MLGPDRLLRLAIGGIVGVTFALAVVAGATAGIASAPSEPKPAAVSDIPSDYLALYQQAGLAYNVRIDHLSGQAGGVNGPYVLTNATVHSDAVSDDLFGGSGLDWFFAQLSGANPDKIKKQDPGRLVGLGALLVIAGLWLRRRGSSAGG